MARKDRNLMLVNFSCFILFLGTSYSETDTLQHGQKLKFGDELVSEYRIFKLGFFIQARLRNKYHVGIWYNWLRKEGGWTPNGDEVKPVWIANKNTHVYEQSGILTISGSDGNLKIFYNGRDPISITHNVRVSFNSSTSATLLDNGNFVLRDFKSNRVLWQSFDYPTDTLLPGMKLGINLETGHSWSLTSWDAFESVLGPYTFGMDRNRTNQLMIWLIKDIYWTGPLTRINGSFKLSSYHFSYFSNENEKYFTYDVDDDSNTFPMIVLDNYGSLSDFHRTLIGCDSYDHSVGCTPACRKHPIFKWNWGYVYGDSFKFNDSQYVVHFEDCVEQCSRNCSCVAYAYDDNTGCQIWSNITSLRQTDESGLGQLTEIYVVESDPKPKGKKLVLWLIIGVGGALVLFLFCFFRFLIIWKIYKKPIIQAMTSACRQWKLKTMLLACGKCKENCVKFLRSVYKTNTEQEMLLSELGMGSRYGKNSHELLFFDFESIASATNNFASLNKLGEGGFGPVYKGHLPDGQEVAIKRLSADSRQGLVEFKNEVKVIAKLQHNNLVRLVGCCIEKEEKILIYEYMPNKSLDFFLFGTTNQNVLDWKKRFNIIEGIAQGLLYLHKYSRLKIIHRDLKASNILLDSEMNPKISDFGMAKIFELQESKANTIRVVGTYGYMPPEYAIEGLVSTKSDVFSFGVLVLEIVSGKRNNSFHHAEGPLNLTIYAWELWRQDRGLELIDPRLGDVDRYQNEALRCIHVGLLCTQENPMDRPTMLDVISMIYNIEAYQLLPPKQPAFYNRKTPQMAEIEEQRRENRSINGVSITQMIAR